MVSPDTWYTQCSGDDSSMGSRCDCPRQSIDFDSLRGAPPCNVSDITRAVEWYYACRGGNLPPTGPQGRNRGTFVSASTNGASPSPGLDGGAPRSESKSIDCRGQSHIDFIVGSTPLHCSVYWVIPFNRTGCIRDVAGGRLPPLHARR